MLLKRHIRNLIRALRRPSRYRVIICHGSGGSPEGNWFPWAKERFEGLGHEVLVPRFPPQERQSLASWMGAFSEQVGTLQANDVLIGHSTGSALVLNLLNDATAPVWGTFLVAGFIGEIGSAIYDPLNTSFFETSFRWSRIRENAGDLFIYSGSNDPYVPLTKGQDMAIILGAPLTVIEKGGHLNAESGYLTFEKLLEDFTKNF